MAGAADFVAPRPLAVTVGNYLLMYAVGRFSRHPRFRYFALNTEIRWRALQVGWICIRQHPHDAQLFIFDCVNMVVILSSLLQSQALRRNVHVRSHTRARARAHTHTHKRTHACTHTHIVPHLHHMRYASAS